jgi:NADPH:quinone reductase-like Zn-dependent oxidoreductase
MEHSVENTYVAVENGEYKTKKETISLKAPAGHVVVKVGYSTCDPYDGICSHLFKSEGVRLGGEAAGQIVSIGEGVSQELNNKKISFHFQGTWANYVTLNVSTSHFIILHDSQDLKQAAASWINPLTALGQLEILESRPSKWFVADAAASSLNKMLIKLVREKGYEAICIVRREEQAEILKKEYGVKHVIL